MGGNSTELQKILPALEKVVPVLAPGRHKGQAGKLKLLGSCAALPISLKPRNLNNCSVLNVQLMLIGAVCNPSGHAFLDCHIRSRTHIDC